MFSLGVRKKGLDLSWLARPYIEVFELGAFDLLLRRLNLDQLRREVFGLKLRFIDQHF